jgi:hypothetical protein
MFKHTKSCSEMKPDTQSEETRSDYLQQVNMGSLAYSGDVSTVA